MIAGVGIDVVDIDRFTLSLERTPGLRDRLFAETERELSHSSLAARFAAKEALAKALGVPRGLQWHDAVVRNEDSGRPYFDVSGSVAQAINGRTIHLSLSHDGGIASAIVILESL